MLESEIAINRFLTGYCRKMMEDLPDERLTEQAVPGVNHPAWIIGHLAFVAHRGVALLTGAEMALPESWQQKFGPGSKLTATRADYPSKEELLKTLQEAHSLFQRTASAATPERLAQPSQHPRLKDPLPTVKDLAAFLLTGHLGVHLGQLSMWRRMIGLPALF